MQEGLLGGTFFALGAEGLHGRDALELELRIEVVQRRLGVFFFGQDVFIYADDDAIFDYPWIILQQPVRIGARSP